MHQPSQNPTEPDTVPFERVPSPYSKISYHARKSGRVFASPLAGPIGFAFVATLAYGAWAYYHCGSFSAALAYVEGESLLVDPGHLDFGEGKRGSIKDLSLRVMNLTSAPIDLLGAKRSCTCIATDDFPLTVEAGNTRVLHVKVNLAKDGDFSQQLDLWTSSQDKPRCTIGISGRVNP